MHNIFKQHFLVTTKGLHIEGWVYNKIYPKVRWKWLHREPLVQLQPCWCDWCRLASGPASGTLQLELLIHVCTPNGRRSVKSRCVVNQQSEKFYCWRHKYVAAKIIQFSVRRLGLSPSAETRPPKWQPGVDFIICFMP